MKPPCRLAELGPWGPGLLAAAVLSLLALLQTLEHLPPPLPWLGASLILLLAAWRWRGLLHMGLLCLALLGLALAWGSWRSAEPLQTRLPTAWEGRDLQVEAEVVALPQALDGFGEQPLWRLTLAPLGPGVDGTARVPLPPRVSVWFDGAEPPRGGERWRFTLRLRRVHALQNPGLPDAELWMLERGIGSQGSVRKPELLAKRLAAAPWWSLQGARQSLRDAMQQRIAEPRARAVISGLLLGDQAAMSAADWALLRDTGVVHLFSISGIHITGFAWLAGALIQALWRRRPDWCERLPAPLAARWGGLALATGYALLAGWGVPAQRTVLLLAGVSLLASSGRLWPWALTLLVAALPIALLDPWALVQPGFWLSFVAVALLMQQGSGRQAWWREMLQTQAVATLGLAPLGLVFFGQLSLVGAFANLLAVPLVTLLLTPLVLLGVLLPPAWSLAAWLSDALFAVLQPLAALPWAVWSPAQAPALLQGLALLGLLLAVLRLPRWLRALGLLALLPMLLHTPPRPAPGSFSLQVLDVGQGSALWVQTANHLLVYDAGPRWGLSQDAGARVLLPSLRAAGFRHVDSLVLSHGDADHSGGAPSLRAGLLVEQLWLSPDPRLAPLAGRRCVAGEGWDWDGVRFRFLHPGPQALSRSPNASGCVLRVDAANGASLLIPADIGRAEEAELAPRDLPATVLLLPHHGSAGSSSERFLDAVRPQLAFAQAGYRSRHGHPALAVQNRLRERSIPLLSSAGCGAWHWHSDEAPSAGGCWREQRRRYWLQRFDAEPTPSEEGPQRPDTMPP